MSFLPMFPPTDPATVPSQIILDAVCLRLVRGYITPRFARRVLARFRLLLWEHPCGYTIHDTEGRRLAGDFNLPPGMKGV